MQPFGVRLVVYVNTLFWGIQIPIFGSNLMPQIFVTIFVGLFFGVRRNVISIKLVIFTLMFAFYGLFLYFIGPCLDGEIKVIFSLIVFVFLAFSLNWIVGVVRFDIPLVSVREATVMAYLVAFVAVSEFAIKFLAGTPLNELRVGGLYLEPSHLAISMSPIVFYLWMFGGRFKTVLVILIFFIVSYSSTLILIMGSVFLLPFLGRLIRRGFRLNELFAVAALGGVMVVSFDILSDSDTFLRINDLVDLRQDSNLSSLVYANGWQLLGDYLNSTYGLGLGANAMGCSPLGQTEIADWLNIMDLGNQNSNDGSFLLSKIGSEFGVLGICLFVLLVVYVVKILLGITSKSDPLEVITVGWLAVVAIGGVVRSAGYFSGPIVLGVFAFMVLEKRRKKHVFYLDK